MDNTFVAIIGCYRSGSSLIAEILSEMGVDMGAPFHLNYFEPADLSAMLRYWWAEPALVENVSVETRLSELSKWMSDRPSRNRSQTGCQFFGAKHPLLTLSAAEIVDAWDGDMRIIWSYRQLESSTHSLERTGWWENCPRIQSVLFESASRFFGPKKHLKVDYDDMLENPHDQVRLIADYIGIELSLEESDKLAKKVSKRPRKSAQVLSSRNTLPDASQNGRVASERIVATMLASNNSRVVAPAVNSVIE